MYVQSKNKESVFEKYFWDISKEKQKMIGAKKFLLKSLQLYEKTFRVQYNPFVQKETFEHIQEHVNLSTQKKRNGNYNRTGRTNFTRGLLRHYFY